MASKYFAAMIACVVVSAVYVNSSDVHEQPKRPEDYPQDKFDKHVDKSNIATNKKYEKMKYRVQINDEYKYNCHTKVTTYQPFEVTTNNTRKFVVQSRYFQQWIQKTECLNNDAECFSNIKNRLSLFNKIPTCKTVKTSVKLHLYNPKEDKFEYVYYDIPSCCVCSMK